MTEYEFTLSFRLKDLAEDPARHVEALGAAGCTDAVVGIGQAGRIALQFTRAARSAQAAVASALREVRRAIPGAALVEASPDYVGATDIAALAGFSRQNMRKLVDNNPATFPAAVHDGSPALWHLAEALAWLRDHHGFEIDARLLDVSRATMRLNVAKEARKLAGFTLPREFASLLA